MNDAVTLYLEGKKYLDGTDGYPVNYKMAFDLFSQAAQLGLAEAHIELAFMYDTGEIGERDGEKAVEHFHLAYYANPESKFALYYMAKLYAKGLGVDIDYNKAISFLNSYLRLAEPNHVLYCEACHLIGYIMLKNERFTDAVPYVSIASREIVHAKYQIGWLSYNGYAKDKYYQDPFTCFKEAAEKGSVNAMHDLGILYNRNQMFDEGTYWLEKAAKNGDKESEALLKKLKKIRNWGSSFL